MRAIGWDQADAEFAEAGRLVHSLAEAEWDAPSLCAGWRVRDVVVHLLMPDELAGGGAAAVLAAVIKGRLSLDRINAQWVDENASRDSHSLRDALRRSGRPKRLVRLLGAGHRLSEAFIHRRDIAVPLGRERAAAPDRARAVLDHMLSARGSFGLDARRRAAGLHLVATDLRWQHGMGPEVSGQAESIILALAGRDVVLSDLAGAGVTRLARRMPWS